jgi:hypothetical protein
MNITLDGAKFFNASNCASMRKDAASIVQFLEKQAEAMRGGDLARLAGCLGQHEDQLECHAHSGGEAPKLDHARMPRAWAVAGHEGLQPLCHVRTDNVPRHSPCIPNYSIWPDYVVLPPAMPCHSTRLYAIITQFSRPGRTVSIECHA